MALVEVGSDQPMVSANESVPETKDSGPPRVTRIEVLNFRLLQETAMVVDIASTVLVGRNNTGKTSLAEVVQRFLDDRQLKLELADFSAATYEKFADAYVEFLAGKEDQARALMPVISVTLTIQYGAALAEFGPLGPLIVDLDPSCTETKLEISYRLASGKLRDFFRGASDLHEPGERCETSVLMELISERVPEMFVRMCQAIDATDPSNVRDISLALARAAVKVDFLGAQRGLNDEKEKPRELIGKILESLFAAASKGNEQSAHRKTADALNEAVAKIELDLGKNVQSMVEGVVPALNQFGYPGIGSFDLSTQTKLNVENVLSDYTTVYYAGTSGVSYPESYTGLGSRNLVMMLLTLLGFYRDYALRGSAPGVHLVFIEEPEAHLHPQMQEVFIAQLAVLKRLFPEIDKLADPWSAQFVVSTHSSHVANKAAFSALRYFRVDPSTAGLGNHTDILDLSVASGLDEAFLHKYLTLTRSDLFFADKAILVEGATERLIVPRVVEMIAAGASTSSALNQYITLLEVGGAYAHLFFPLLDFLKLPSLVITDIDPIGPLIDGRRSAALAHEGDRTSNATIKAWFKNAEITPSDLLVGAAAGETCRGDRYIAYQVSEASGGPCGRTFEDAFILANPAVFGISVDPVLEVAERTALEVAKEHKKSEFALRFAVAESGWTAPRYLVEGLTWLFNYVGPSPAEALAPVEVSEDDE